MAMDYSDKLTPRSAAQTLQDYQDNHQIELFMQEMLSVVCTLLPEDPYEYMMNHVVSNRPAPPPAESHLCGSGALWVLLRDGDPECAEHWRLRRCWLTGKGSFCISTEPATVTREGAKVKMKAPKNTASATHPIEVGGSFRELDEAARPFAFILATGGKELFLAAGSEEQRDEWFNLLGHFADADRRKGPLPKSNIVSPRTGGTQVVDSIGPADIPMVQPVKDPAKVVQQSQPRQQDPAKTLKPILKTKPSHVEPGKVPAIRIPRRLPNDPMEACGDSTRRSSIRFSDDVERHEFSVNRAEPVPANMRAHESRRKPAMGTVKARTQDGQEVEVRQRPKAIDPKEKGEEVQTILSSPHSERLEGEIGKNIVQNMLDQVSSPKRERDSEIADDPLSPAGVTAASLVDDLIAESQGDREGVAGDSIVPSARSSASPGEVIGEIAAGMLDSMMLDPIISIMDEPVDPAMLLFGETPADTPAHGDTLVLPPGNEFVEGSGKEWLFEEMRKIEELRHQAQKELDAAERDHRSAEEKARQAGDRWRHDELQKLEELRLQAQKELLEAEDAQNRTRDEIEKAGEAWRAERLKEIEELRRLAQKQLDEAKQVGEMTAAELQKAEERREEVRKELEAKRKALDEEVLEEIRRQARLDMQDSEAARLALELQQKAQKEMRDAEEAQRKAIEAAQKAGDEWKVEELRKISELRQVAQKELAEAEEAQKKAAEAARQAGEEWKSEELRKVEDLRKQAEKELSEAEQAQQKAFEAAARAGEEWRSPDLQRLEEQLQQAQKDLDAAKQVLLEAGQTQVPESEELESIRAIRQKAERDFQLAQEAHRQARRCKRQAQQELESARLHVEHDKAAEESRKAEELRIQAEKIKKEAEEAYRQAEAMRQQAQQELEAARRQEVPQLPLEQNRSTIVAAQGDQELTSRSMGRLSATQSEIYRDVFNDAAVSLVADIFSESISAAEETKRKVEAQKARLNVPQRDKGDDEWTVVSVQASNLSDLVAQNLSNDVLNRAMHDHALDDDERISRQARAQAALIQEAARRAAASEDQDASTAVAEADEWIRVAEENMRHALQLAQRALDAAQGKDGQYEAQSQASKDRKDSKVLENHVAVQRVTNDLLGQLLGAAAGSEASDAIDTTDVSEVGGNGAAVEDLMVLVFDTLDYKTLNHTVFIEDLLCGLRGLGLAEKHAAMLQIQLSPGSVVAEIFGPPMVGKHLQAVHVDLLDVMGCIPRKLMKAPRRRKQSRPVTSLSNATVLSADSSNLLEAQANELLNLWIDSPKSDALTNRSLDSSLDALANQMVKQFAVNSVVSEVTPEESAQQVITAAKAKARQQEPDVIEDFNEDVPDFQRVAATATETAIRAAPRQAVTEDATPDVQAETSRPVTADTQQSGVPYVIYATNIANSAVTNAAISECPTSVVLSEAGNSPHGQQFESFIRETLDRSTAAAAAAAAAESADVMPETSPLHPFASELAQEITQDALDTLETDAQQQAGGEARQAQATTATAPGKQVQAGTATGEPKQAQQQEKK